MAAKLLLTPSMSSIMTFLNPTTGAVGAGAGATGGTGSAAAGAGALRSHIERERLSYAVRRRRGRGIVPQRNPSESEDVSEPTVLRMGAPGTCCFGGRADRGVFSIAIFESGPGETGGEPGSVLPRGDDNDDWDISESDSTMMAVCGLLIQGGLNMITW